MRRWRERDYSSPAPARVKQRVLARHGVPTGYWIETGTYQGDTTAFLARAARHVYSIEPGPELVELARERFARTPNVTIVEGLSEDRIGDLLDGLSGTVSLWLDGHWSAGRTFRGPIDTPILAELAMIEQRLARFDDVRVMIDDVRLFDPDLEGYAHYPNRTVLVEWAQRNGLHWTIEHDIFIAITSPIQKRG